VAGDRERLNRAQRERAGAVDQQFFIEGAQLPLGFPRRARETLRGALGATKGNPGEGKPPE
jgi:hypothetical protein